MNSRPIKEEKMVSKFSTMSFLGVPQLTSASPGSPWENWFLSSPVIPQSLYKRGRGKENGV